MTLLFVLSACRRDDTLLTDAGRVSMALRGVRPSEREIDELLGGDVTLEVLARRWVRTPAFSATIRDLHAEHLQARYDTQPHPPPLGPLAAWTPAEITASLDEEPLRLVSTIVEQGRPYTEILTADTTVADPIVAAAYGLAHDPALVEAGGPEWQELPWPDDRPAAGILASTSLWQRHMSSDRNFQRDRANVLLSSLLCTSLDAVDGIRTPSLSADAVREDPLCVGCHLQLDPLASAFYGFRGFVQMESITESYAQDCPEGSDCYPLAYYDPADVATRVEDGMPAPAWGAVEVDGLAELTALVAEDPRFATCTARRFATWFSQVDEVAPDRVAALADGFVDSGYDARALAVAVVLDPAFLAGPPLLVRPEQLARLVPDLTGHTWEGLAPDGTGTVAFATTDEHGLRAMMGGMDGWNSVRPSHGPGPVREFAWRWYLSEAAAAAVRSGRVVPVTDAERIDATLERLHRRWLLEERPDLAPDRALFDEVFARTGDAEHAWTVVLTALLLDDRVVTF
jgi:hypothetical protein